MIASMRSITPIALAGRSTTLELADLIGSLASSRHQPHGIVQRQAGFDAAHDGFDRVRQTDPRETGSGTS